MTARFDPTRAIVYDLARGQLRDDEGAARLNLPAHLLTRLCEQAGAEATREFAQAIGTELGRRVADRMGDDLQRAQAFSWAEHLGGQLALLGLGNLSIERWGKALVLSVQGYPASMDTLLIDILSAALQRSLSRDVGVVAFPDQDLTRYLVLSPGTAERARGLIAAGEGLGQVIETLHKGAA